MWLACHFGLPDIPEVSLLRTYTNDVYLVQARDERFVLKLYGAGWRHDSEIRFEIELLRHLRARGVGVAQPIAGVDGDALQVLPDNGVTRQAVLFAYAPGVKPKPPFSPAMYHREGRAVATLHAAADDFRSPHERRPLNLATLVDAPLALVCSLDIDRSVRRSILDFGSRIRGEIDTLANAGLDWGICHGDLTFDNLHLTGDGEFVWYDFDSGGYGWRAIDMQGWTALDAEWLPLGQAFRDGYREIRPLSDNDVAAAPYLAAAQELWGIQVELERRVLAKGKPAVQAYLAECVVRFSVWRARLGISA